MTFKHPPKIRNIIYTYKYPLKNKAIMQNRTDIKVLPGNTRGSDFITGDVHGSINAFKESVKKLGKHDRLMIVGDLTDRGEDSMAVLDTIIEINRKTPGKINAIRGNHEDMLLKYLEMRLLMHERSEWGEEPSEAELKQYQSVVAKYRKNGGGWMIDNDNIPIEKLKLYRDYIASLPYIVHVDDENPYHIVHADMPFSDDELVARIKKNQLTLSEEEIEYATWARLSSGHVRIKEVGRTANSIPVYCGHTILEGMRIISNSINLDVGSYLTDCMMVVDHKKLTVELLSGQQKPLDADMQYLLNMLLEYTSANLKNAICLKYRERSQQAYEDTQTALESLTRQQLVFEMKDINSETEQIQSVVAIVISDEKIPVFIKQAFINDLRRSIQNDQDAIMNKVLTELRALANEWLSKKGAELANKRGGMIQDKLNHLYLNDDLTTNDKMATLKNVLDLSKVYRLLHEIETLDRLFETKYRQRMPDQATNEKINPAIKLAERVQKQLDLGAKIYASMYEDLQKALESYKNAVLAQAPPRFFGKKQHERDKERLVSILDEVKSRNTYRF